MQMTTRTANTTTQAMKPLLSRIRSPSVGRPNLRIILHALRTVHAAHQGRDPRDDVRRDGTEADVLGVDTRGLELIVGVSVNLALRLLRNAVAVPVDAGDPDLV